MKAFAWALAWRLLPALLWATTAPAIAQQTQLELARRHITHVIVVMQENRSFDNYFGTFPGAEGIPRGVCVPNNPGFPPAGCTAPFHDTALFNAGGPHANGDYLADYDGGAMDGFIHQQRADGAPGCGLPQSQACAVEKSGVRAHDVVGYHTAAEIPNYWTYAAKFVLMDHLFESVANYSFPAHLAMVSGWFANCASADPMSCAPVG